jgi:hypothetical protein
VGRGARAAAAARGAPAGGDLLPAAAGVACTGWRAGAWLA